MARWAYLLTTFVALAAWAGAQGPAPEAPLPADDHVRLLKANGTLIDNLVGNGVELARAERIELRAAECHKAARALASAIRDAAARQNAERVAELTSLFSDVVGQALEPTLERGFATVPRGSPAWEALHAVSDGATKDVTDLKAAIPTTGKVGENARVKIERQKLDGLLNK